MLAAKNLQGKGYINFHISNPCKNLVLALVIDKIKKEKEKKRRLELQKDIGINERVQHYSYKVRAILFLFFGKRAILLKKE